MGILDADLTGPCVPKMMGLKGHKMELGARIFTETCCDAVNEMKALEGIPIDHTFTGKALSGGLD